MKICARSAVCFLLALCLSACNSSDESATVSDELVPDLALSRRIRAHRALSRILNRPVHLSRGIGDLRRAVGLRAQHEYHSRNEYS